MGREGEKTGRERWGDRARRLGDGERAMGREGEKTGRER